MAAKDVFEFGNELLRSKDLDPTYVILYEVKWSRDVLKRWLTAYWFFYDVGTASWITSQDGFYGAVRSCLKHAPRGAERRHFRGDAAAKAVDQWERRWPEPTRAIDSWSAETFEEYAAMAKAEAHVGDWIVYKMADMTERVLARPLKFPNDMTGWYSEPKAGAMLVARELGASSANEAVQELLRYRWETYAPPRFDRPVGIQEVETICCKFKAYRAGRYEAGTDWKAIRNSLRRTKSARGDELSVLAEKFGGASDRQRSWL